MSQQYTKRIAQMTSRAAISKPIGYAMAALAAFGLALALAFVVPDYPIEWAEGRVFETARLIAAHAPIYCDLQKLPCADLTYPPGYAFLVAALGRIFGLGFRTGRAVTFAALLWSLHTLYRIARLRSGKLYALAAPAVFLCFVEACFFAGTMRPDLLSLALVLFAIEVLLYRPSRSGAAASALLLLLGLCTKPQAFAAAAAICLYLAAVDRKRLVVFVAVGAIAGAVVLALAFVLSGGRFLDHHFWYIVSLKHTVSQLGSVLFYGALAWIGFIGVALYQSARTLRRAPIRLVSIYFLATVVWAIATSSGSGAAANYLLELYSATALAVSDFLADLREPTLREPSLREPSLRQPDRLDRVGAAVLSMQIVLCVFLNPWIGLERALSIRKSWSGREALASALRTAPEPILVEDPGVAGYTGHRLFVNTYVATQLSTERRWDERPLLAMLEQQRFSSVVLREAPADHPTSLQRERFTAGMLQAIAAHYRVSWSDGNWFVYEPRDRSALTVRPR